MSTIAEQLRTVYNRLCISMNFVASEISTCLKRGFYATPALQNSTYSIQAGKIYYMDFTNVASPVINLTTEQTLLPGECPEWDFFVKAGSNAPAWSRDGSSITISWPYGAPPFSSGTGNTFEINIVYVNGDPNLYNGYNGLWTETQATS